MEDEYEWSLSYERHRERKMTDLLYGERYLKKIKKKLKLDVTTTLIQIKIDKTFYSAVRYSIF